MNTFNWQQQDRFFWKGQMSQVEAHSDQLFVREQLNLPNKQNVHQGAKRHGSS